MAITADTIDGVQVRRIKTGRRERYVASLRNHGFYSLSAVPDPGERTWCIVYTQANREFFAAGSLRQRGIRVFLPHRKQVIRHARSERQVLKAHYPRYLFASVEPGSGRTIYDINTCPGVSVALSIGQKVIEAPGELITLLQQRTDDKGLVTTGVLEPGRDVPKPGDYVRLTREMPAFGILSGFLAVVEKVDGSGFLSVCLEAFGKRVRVGLEPEGWEAISP